MCYEFSEVAAVGYIELLDTILEHRRMPVRCAFLRFTDGMAIFSLTEDLVHYLDVEACGDFEDYCNHILREEGFPCLDYAHCRYRVPGEEYSPCANGCCT
jgi:hypothetical protein